MFDFRDNELYCEDVAVKNVFSMYSINYPNPHTAVAQKIADQR